MKTRKNIQQQSHAPFINSWLHITIDKYSTPPHSSPGWHWTLESLSTPKCCIDVNINDFLSLSRQLTIIKTDWNNETWIPLEIVTEAFATALESSYRRTKEPHVLFLFLPVACLFATVPWFKFVFVDAALAATVPIATVPFATVPFVDQHLREITRQQFKHHPANLETPSRPRTWLVSTLIFIWRPGGKCVRPNVCLANSNVPGIFETR